MSNTVQMPYKKLLRHRRIAENSLVFLLQYCGLLISTLVIPLAPVALASGTACGFLFLRGVSVLPGIVLGSYLAFLTHYDWPLRRITHIASILNHVDMSLFYFSHVIILSLYTCNSILCSGCQCSQFV